MPVSDSNLLAKVYIDPHHPSTLQLRLAELWQDGQFFDASLEVDDHRLPVQNAVIATDHLRFLARISLVDLRFSLCCLDICRNFTIASMLSPL